MSDTGKIKGSILLVIVLLIAGFLALSMKKEEQDGEKKKTATGRSYVKETRVEKFPKVSTLTTAFASERVWSGQDDWEPAIAADPSSSYVYQMTTRYTGPKPCSNCTLPAIVVRASSNGGATWGPDRFVAQTKKTQNDPQVEVSLDGSIYAVFLNDYNPGIHFTKSTDRGVTWSTPIRLTGGNKKPRFSDKPILAISPNGQHVYIGFNASDSWVTASHDFGQTFAEAVKTSSDTRYWFHCAGAVAANGDVYFAVTDYSQTYAGDSNINVLKSTNQGVSWTTTRVDTSKEMPPCPWAPGCYFGFLGPSAGLDIDSSGKILLAYNAGNVAGAPQQIYVRTSLNGTSWSARQQISESSSSINNAFPVVAAGTGSNDFRVVWQDDRNGSTNAWNTWYRRTTSGGSTWTSALRLSNESSGAPYKTAAGYFFPYGDYLEMDVDSGGTNHILWGAGTSYDGPGGTWYTSGN
jgi:hypothetical protein